jgi:PEP-CTERM motif
MTSAFGSLSANGCARYCIVMHSSRAGRIAAGVIVVLVVAAAATASMQWTQWRPTTACLFCGSGNLDVSATAASTSAAPEAVSAAGSARAPLGTSRATTAASAATTTSRSAEEVAAPVGKVVMGRHAWQPWGPNSGSHRSYVGNPAGPSASMGGLWRQMSLSRPGSTAPAVSESTVARAERSASTPRQPRSAPPAAGPRPPGGAAPAPPSSPPAFAEPAPVLVPPMDPFHEHETPLPGPFDQPPPAGPLDPGGPGGVGGGGDLSANPEPASMLLIGTGLLGIYGVLRRRRLI